MDIKGFKENLLFELFKNNTHFSRQKQREKIQGEFKDLDIPSIHKKITNYQVDKYGESLDGVRNMKEFVAH